MSREKIERAIAFFASCIKSGEPWTEHCQKVYDEALSAPAPKEEGREGWLTREQVEEVMDGWEQADPDDLVAKDRPMMLALCRMARASLTRPTDAEAVRVAEVVKSVESFIAEAATHRDGLYPALYSLRSFTDLLAIAAQAALTPPTEGGEGMITVTFHCSGCNATAQPAPTAAADGLREALEAKIASLEASIKGKEAIIYGLLTKGTNQ